MSYTEAEANNSYPGAAAVAEAHPSAQADTTPPTDPTADWLGNLKGAIAAFRKKCELTRVIRGRGVAASSIDVLHAALAACRAAASRPMPGRYAKMLPAVEALADRLIERFEILREAEFGYEINVGPIIDAVDLLEQRLATCGQRKRRESPRDLLQLPNLSTAQVVKMLPGISAAQWDAYKLDQVNNPLPELPAEPEAAAIDTLETPLHQLLDRVGALAGDTDVSQLDREIERQDEIIREANAKARELESRRERLARSMSA